jgi:hypothetical protein
MTKKHLVCDELLFTNYGLSFDTSSGWMKPVEISRVEFGMLVIVICYLVLLLSSQSIPYLCGSRLSRLEAAPAKIDAV